MSRAWIWAILGLLAASSVWAVEVHDVRLWRAPDHTRIVFDLTGPCRTQTHCAANPESHRAGCGDTSLKADLSDLKLDNTPVARVRSGVREGDDLRVVLEVSASVDPRSFASRPMRRPATAWFWTCTTSEAKPAAVKKSVKQSASATLSSPSMPGTAVKTRGHRVPNVCGKRTWCWPSPKSSMPC